MKDELFIMIQDYIVKQLQTGYDLLSLEAKAEVRWVFGEWLANKNEGE